MGGHRERERERERETERERQRQTDRQTDRHRETQGKIRDGRSYTDVTLTVQLTLF